jgi:hypothetical protein
VRPWPLEQGETTGDLTHVASVNLVIESSVSDSLTPHLPD